MARQAVELSGQQSEAILITGGAGFLGSSVGARLERTHRVHVIDNLSRGTSTHVPAESVFHLGDVRNKREVVQVLSSEQFGAIVHCAAATSSFGGEEMESSNVAGTGTVVECALRFGVRRFVLISSCAVYGEAETAADEDTLTRPISAYGRSKLQAERIVAASELQHVILRPSNVYGPASDTGGVVEIFLRRLLTGETVEIFGDGLQVRDFVFVDNVVDAVALSLAYSDSATWNVASGESISICGLLEAVARLIGKQASVRHRPPRTDDIRNSLVSIGRLKSTGLWAPQTTLEEGLGRMVLSERTRNLSLA